MGKMVSDTHNREKKKERAAGCHVYEVVCVCVCVYTLNGQSIPKGSPVVSAISYLSVCAAGTLLPFKDIPSIFFLFSFHFINSPFSSSKRERERELAKEIHGYISDRQTSMLCVPNTSVWPPSITGCKYFFIKVSVRDQFIANELRTRRRFFYSSTIVGRKKQWKGRT